MPELEGVVPPVATPFGGVTSMSPRVSVELWDAVQSGDHERTRTIHETTPPLARRVVRAREGNYPGSVVAATTPLAAMGDTPGTRSASPTKTNAGGSQRPSMGRDHGVYETADTEA